MTDTPTFININIHGAHLHAYVTSHIHKCMYTLTQPGLIHTQMLTASQGARTRSVTAVSLLGTAELNIHVTLLKALNCL